MGYIRKHYGIYRANIIGYICQQLWDIFDKNEEVY